MTTEKILYVFIARCQHVSQYTQGGQDHLPVRGVKFGLEAGKHIDGPFYQNIVPFHFFRGVDFARQAQQFWVELRLSAQEREQVAKNVCFNDYIFQVRIQVFLEQPANDLDDESGFLGFQIPFYQQLVGIIQDPLAMLHRDLDALGNKGEQNLYELRNWVDRFASLVHASFEQELFQCQAMQLNVVDGGQLFKQAKKVLALVQQLNQFFVAIFQYKKFFNGRGALLSLAHNLGIDDLLYHLVHPLAMVLSRIPPYPAFFISENNREHAVDDLIIGQFEYFPSLQHPQKLLNCFSCQLV